MRANVIQPRTDIKSDSFEGDIDTECPIPPILNSVRSLEEFLF